MNNELIDGINTAEQNEIAFLLPLAVNLNSRVDAIKMQLADGYYDSMESIVERAKLSECESILFEIESRLETFEEHHADFMEHVIETMHERNIDE